MAYLGRPGATAPLTSADIPNDSITSDKIVAGTVETSDLADGAKINTNIALLAFKTASNGSLAKYNLQDQVIDEYTNATGVDADASDNHALASGAYSSVAGASATGGNLVTSYGNYHVHKFTADATGGFVVPTGGLTIDILVVGGGGGGGRAYGGGGGAGGIVFKDNFSAGAGTYNIDIGDGGAGGADGAANNGSNGANSTFIQNTGSTINVTAGYGGGGGRDTQQAGNTGGTSSGGTFIWHGGKGGTGGASSGGAGYIGADGGYINGTTSQNTGTQHATETSATAGAGYTGASNIITDASTTTALLLAAVAGTDSSNAATTSSSNTTLYIGGSGAGAPNWAGVGAASGGIGGGAAGSGNMNQSSGGGPSAADALANTGGGGGGQVAGGYTGGDGGSGVVIIRYGVVYSDLTLQSIDTEAEAQPTKADMVMLVEDAGSGVATLGTHIKGFISRDSGTTFTEGTLVDEGEWGSDRRILAFHDLDISGQPADQTMCYKITTHSTSAVYNTKIHATSMGWR